MLLLRWKLHAPPCVRDWHHYPVQDRNGCPEMEIHNVFVLSVRKQTFVSWGSFSRCVWIVGFSGITYNVVRHDAMWIARIIIIPHGFHIKGDPLKQCALHYDEVNVTIVSSKFCCIFRLKITLSTCLRWAYAELMLSTRKTMTQTCMYRSAVPNCWAYWNNCRKTCSPL